MPLPNSTSFLLSFIFCVSSKSFSSSLAVDATAALIRMCTASDGLVRGCVCLSVCGFCCNQTRVAFRMAGRKRLNLTWQAISLLLASPSQDLLLWENSSDLQEQQHQDCSVQICTVLPLPVSHISHSSTSNHAQAGDKPVQMSSQPHVEYVCVGQTEPGQIGRKKKKLKERTESGSNLMRTTFEMDEEVWPTSQKPVWGEWTVWLANETVMWKKAGGLTEVCQLHNEAPPCLSGLWGRLYSVCVWE